MMNVLLNDQIIKPNDKKFQASLYKKEKGCVQKEQQLWRK